MSSGSAALIDPMERNADRLQLRRALPLVFLIVGCALLYLGKLVEWPSCPCRPPSMKLTCLILQRLPDWSYADVSAAARLVGDFGTALLFVAASLYMLRGAWRVSIGIAILVLGYWVYTSVRCTFYCGERAEIANEIQVECEAIHGIDQFLVDKE